MKICVLFLTVISLTAFSAGAQAINEPFRLTVGKYEVYILNEGGGDAETNLLIDAPAGVLEKYAPKGTFPIATHAVLVREKDSTILIDTGYGILLFENLKKLGGCTRRCGLRIVDPHAW